MKGISLYGLEFDDVVCALLKTPRPSGGWKSVEQEPEPTEPEPQVSDAEQAPAEPVEQYPAIRKYIKQKRRKSRRTSSQSGSPSGFVQQKVKAIDAVIAARERFLASLSDLKSAFAELGPEFATGTMAQLRAALKEIDDANGPPTPDCEPSDRTAEP
jgi:hypothetical protein